MRNFRMNPRAKLEQTLPFTVGHSHRQTTYTRTAWKPNKFVVNAVNHVDLIAGVSVSSPISLLYCEPCIQRGCSPLRTAWLRLKQTDLIPDKGQFR